MNGPNWPSLSSWPCRRAFRRARVVFGCGARRAVRGGAAGGCRLGAYGGRSDRGRARLRVFGGRWARYVPAGRARPRCTPSCVPCVPSDRRDMAQDLRLHSPAGGEPVVYRWPLATGRGEVRSSNTVWRGSRPRHRSGRRPLSRARYERARRSSRGVVDPGRTSARLLYARFFSFR